MLSLHGPSESAIDLGVRSWTGETPSAVMSSQVFQSRLAKCAAMPDEYRLCCTMLSKQSVLRTRRGI
jgi:hypothetical protein